MITLIIYRSDRRLIMGDEVYYVKNVLVVDDQEVNQIVMDGILKYHFGIEASFANDGKEAVDMVSRGDYDLVFMDLNMPVMNGIEAAREIIRTNPSMPIIAVTTNTLDQSRQECFAGGMLDYIMKPLDIKVLKNVMKRYLIT
ncbi:MAG: response regulator [Sulfuricurvum sp.]|nr:response regulator [Sulfuricurvum sp.]